jgi:hypothetical protein
MKPPKFTWPVLAALFLGTSTLWTANAQTAPVTEAGKALESTYTATLDALKAEITKALPTVSPQKKAAYEKASADVKNAEAEATTAQQALGKIGAAKGLIGHAQGKWIGGADKGIAAAQAALKAAKTDAERNAAKAELAKWQANREEGVKALKERQAAYDQLQRDEPKLKKTHEAAQKALAEARTNERNAANALLADLAPILGTDKFDAKLAKAVVITAATPRGLAAFAQQAPANAALVEQLLANGPLMTEMLVAGGASFGHYGRTMEIYTAIQKASPGAKEGNLQRLALATALEHARPITQTNPSDQTNAPSTVDPVKRYLHYEKAFLAGELDPAFKNFTTWEYRHVVNCDSPDEILAWGREMLRTYRPDHIYNPDYGWRYVSSVKTEVPYGSQNVQYDLPSLHKYQNIIMNGGVCGRRAFFGRFMLRSFGIPTWGVTQHKHAALSHWTPKGWVVNLGAGFGSSWWDKDEVSLSGNQFLIETQAREHAAEYLRVLRAQWVSRILGEPAFNDRNKVAGGLWSSTGHLYSVMLSEKAVALGPLGQELAEANEKEQKVVSAAVATTDRKVHVQPDGTILIPAVGHEQSSGKASAMKSFGEGMQLHALGGFKATYDIRAPKAGTYKLTANVATVQTGQQFLFSTADSTSPIETPVPYTKGLWQQTEPVEITLTAGKNLIHFELKPGSRGVTLKDFTLTPTSR